MSAAFHARPRWQRVLFRWWRLGVYSRLPGKNRHGLTRKGYRYVMPPREWSQETADFAIARGQDLAKEHGW